jgi:hypothetical protein
VARLLRFPRRTNARQRVTSLLALAVLLAAACSGAATQPESSIPALPDNEEQPKFLLLFEQSPLPVESLAEQHDAVDELPFDGLLFTIDASSTIQGSQRLGLASLRGELSPLQGVSFDNVRHNFLLVYATPAGPFTSYDTVVQNFADLAQASREAGLQGIFFDNEEYFGPTWRPDVTCPDIDLVQCREQARSTGRAVMTAMIERWPDVQVMTASGPWLSDSGTYEQLKHIGWNDIAGANQVWGAFAVGMLEGAAGTDAAYIDGGGVYTQSSLDDLAVAYDWFRNGMAENGDIVPADLRETYQDEVEIAFGIYDFPEQYRGKVSDPNVWRDDISEALRVADTYVWAYSERFNWTNNPLNPEKAVVPPEYLQATRDARTPALPDDERNGEG